MIEAVKARFPWASYWIALGVIVIFTFWPVVSVWLTYTLAEANGCRVDEGSVHPCMIGGSDWGGALYTLGVLGWFMLATLPLGGGALIVWVVMLVIHFLAWRRRAPKELSK